MRVHGENARNYATKRVARRLKYRICLWIATAFQKLPSLCRNACSRVATGLAFHCQKNDAKLHNLRLSPPARAAILPIVSKVSGSSCSSGPPVPRDAHNLMNRQVFRQLFVEHSHMNANILRRNVRGGCANERSQMSPRRRNIERRRMHTPSPSKHPSQSNMQ